MDIKEAIQKIENSVVISANGCLLSNYGLMENGYSLITIGSRKDGTRKNWLAHRLFYTYYKGDIEKGLDLDHLCRSRNCVNVNHLEQVTRKENVHRGIASTNNRSPRIGLNNLLKTHCINGHEFNEENTYIDSENKRHCRQCRNTRARLSRTS